MKLVIATANANKLREFTELLKGVNMEILSLRDFPNHPPIVEDGKSFAENALKKASTIAQHTGLITIADDSGLEVDCLGGMPGIYSARYAGDGADDKKNNAQLLKELEGVPEEKRGACFKCVLAIVDPSGRQQVVAGEYRGIILTQPRGTYGFGYDPIFLDPVSDLTYSEMEPAHKNQISHRSRALRELLRILPEFLESTSG